MALTACKLQLQRYDLIFVDDSVTADARAATIRAVAKRCDGSSLVLIHDYEVGLYRHAASRFKHRYRFTSLTPNTGIVWNRAVLNTDKLRRLDLLIREAALTLAPTDVEGWLKLMQVNLLREQ